MDNASLAKIIASLVFAWDHDWNHELLFSYQHPHHMMYPSRLDKLLGLKSQAITHFRALENFAFFYAYHTILFSDIVMSMLEIWRRSSAAFWVLGFGHNIAMIIGSAPPMMIQSGKQFAHNDYI
jgi:hypothetical protein